MGQIVHFVQNGGHHAAIVIFVWSDTCVNLSVFSNGVNAIAPGALDATGKAYSVLLREPTPCCGAAPDWSWHWPEKEAS